MSSWPHQFWLKIFMTWIIGNIPIDARASLYLSTSTSIHLSILETEKLERDNHQHRAHTHTLGRRDREAYNVCNKSWSQSEGAKTKQEKRQWSKRMRAKEEMVGARARAIINIKALKILLYLKKCKCGILALERSYHHIQKAKVRYVRAFFPSVLPQSSEATKSQILARAFVCVFVFSSLFGWAFGAADAQFGKYFHFLEN